MTRVYLGIKVIRCGRDLIRIQTAGGMEDIQKGETKAISFDHVASTLDWYCAQGNEMDLEHQEAPEGNPFNAVVITRYPGDDRRADVTFYFDF
jgi:hypothetical protein